MRIIRKENNLGICIVLIWVLGFFIVPFCLYSENSTQLFIDTFKKSLRSKLNSFKNYKKFVYKSQKIISDPKKDLIFIVGSSDLRDSFNREKVENELKDYSVFYLTSSSQTLVESKLLINSMISRELKPKKIILSINDWRITSSKNYGLIGNKIIHRSDMVWKSKFFNWDEKITSPISNTAIFTNFYYENFLNYIKSIGKKSLSNEFDLKKEKTLSEKIIQSCSEDKIIKNKLNGFNYQENIKIIDQIFLISKKINSELILLNLPKISCSGEIKSSLELTRKELLKKNYDPIPLINNFEKEKLSVNSFKDFKHLKKSFSEKLVDNYILLIRE